MVSYLYNRALINGALSVSLSVCMFVFVCSLSQFFMLMVIVENKKQQIVQKLKKGKEEKLGNGRTGGGIKIL